VLIGELNNGAESSSKAHAGGYPTAVTARETNYSRQIATSRSHWRRNAMDHLEREKERYLSQNHGRIIADERIFEGIRTL